MSKQLKRLSGLVESLSTYESLPVSFGGDPPEIVEAEEIDWQTNGWLVEVSSVLPWIGIKNDLAENPQQELMKLFKEIGQKKANQAFTNREGTWQLTDRGIAKLTSALEKGWELKEGYESDIADEESPENAAKKWHEAVSDLDFGEPEELPKITAKVKDWPIIQFVARAKDNELELNPSYQRDVVWKDPDSQLLIESVFRGIPLPAIILHSTHEQKSEIVDGKQRLTAILRFCGEHPKGIELAKTLSTDREVDFELYSTDYKSWLKKIDKAGPKLTKIQKKFLPFTFNVKEPWVNDPITRFNGKYFCQIRDEDVDVAGRTYKIFKVFEYNVDYTIPVIEYAETPLAAIHKVFSLYNKTGKQLNTEELRNAKYHRLALTKLVLCLSGINDVYMSDKNGSVDQNGIRVIHTLLRECSIPSERYGWSKSIGLVITHLVNPPAVDEDNQISIIGTAPFIDGTLKRITADLEDELRDLDNLNKIASILIDGAAIFQQIRTEFRERFINDKTEPNSKWDIFNFIAVWIGCCLVSMTGSGPADISDDMADAVREMSENDEYTFLEKTQTRTQWRYIGWIVRRLVEITSENELVVKAQKDLFEKDTLAAYETLKQPMRKEE
jgi:hypothetical protein